MSHILMLIDSHCHLDLLDNLSQVIANAKDKDVKKIILPCINYDSCEKALEIANKYNNIFLAFGVHPEEISNNIDFRGEMKKIDTLINQSKDKIVAIGECGLDFKFPDNLSKQDIQVIKDKQIQLFKLHMDLAKKYNLPIIIHNRRATQDLIGLVEDQNLKGIFHCFVGGKKTVKQILELNNFYFGLGGIITFDEGLAIVAGTIPLDKIILETDAPYLAPMPVKLEKPWPNEPANIFHIANKLAQTKETNLSEISKITTNNCKTLFKI